MHEESTFRHYIDKHKEFSTYFTKVKQQKTKPIVRYETAKAEQMQIDWKESLKFTLKNGELIEFNILVSLMSYSRFRIYRLSLSKTRDVLLSLLTDTFEALGGVPERVLVDNMSTVMDEPRTKYKRGKVNNQFQQFADDFGFKVQPCIAGRPETKAKVESPMRILDELMAYNGELDYEGLVRKLKEINDRENHRFHTSYQGIPILLFNKEKDSLHPLPTKDIRSQYKIKHRLVKVNKSSMISVASHQYSVPSKYIDKRLSIQIYDNQIHVYHSTDLVVIHPLSNNPLNYKEEHYIEALHQTLSYKEDNAIEKRAKENLKKIGARYDTNRL